MDRLIVDPKKKKKYKLGLIPESFVVLNFYPETITHPRMRDSKASIIQTGQPYTASVIQTFEKYRRMEIFRGAPRCSFGLKLSNEPGQRRSPSAAHGIGPRNLISAPVYGYPRFEDSDHSFSDIDGDHWIEVAPRNTYRNPGRRSLHSNSGARIYSEG